MNFMKIKKNDVANGEGVRVSLFTSGCEFYCKGCFNYDAWDFKSGQPFTFRDYLEIEEELSKNHVDGITFLGGEPLHPRNIEGVAKIILKIKKKFPHKTIWVYSGYTFEELLSRMSDEFALDYIINSIDVLVDGLFVDELKDPSLAFRGSSNQRVIRLSERAKEKALEQNDNYSELLDDDYLDPEHTFFDYSIVKGDTAKIDNRRYPDQDVAEYKYNLEKESATDEENNEEDNSENPVEENENEIEVDRKASDIEENASTLDNKKDAGNFFEDSQDNKKTDDEVLLNEEAGEDEDII